jgi:hypothetical protein
MFSLPMHELTNTDHEARAVLGAWIDELEQCLGDSRSFEERVRIADAFLIRRCSMLSSPDGITTAALLILRRRGCIQVPALAQIAGFSARNSSADSHAMSGSLPSSTHGSPDSKQPSKARHYQLPSRGRRWPIDWATSIRCT